jgi:Flp pilus assembly protein TadD
LQIANTGLLLILLYMLFQNVWAAALTALLFGVHPLTVEPIPWLSERKTTLSTFFALGAILLYLRYTRRPRVATYVALAVAYVLGLMAKPTVIALPLMLLLMDVWPLRRIGRSGAAAPPGRTARASATPPGLSVRRAVLEKLPLLGIAGLFAIITYVSQAHTSAAVLPTSGSPWRVPVILAHNIVFYLGKIVWPANLTTHYPMPVPLDLSQRAVLAGVVGTVVLISLLILSLRWTRALMVGWLIFFVAIFPTMGVIGFTNVIAADKYVYFPAVGLLMIMAYYLSRLFRREKPAAWQLRVAAIAVAVIVAGAEAAGARRYLVHWHDTEAFCRRILQFAPHAGIAHMELSIELGNQGRLAEALQHAREAVHEYPDYAKAQYNLGLALALSDQLDEAIEAFAAAVRLSPGYQQARYNLGMALVMRNRGAEAIPNLRALTELNPQYADAYYLLGMALEQAGQRQDAVAAYERVIMLDARHAKARERLTALQAP